MANTLKFGNGEWATKEGSTLAYNDENGNFKPLPFDFTRATTATRVNKEGLIEVVGNNEPRIDFLDNTEGALLLEPQRTNFIPYSTLDFNGGSSPSGWSIGFGTGSYSYEQLEYKGQKAVKQTQITTGRSYLDTGTITILANTEHTLKIQFILDECVADANDVICVVNGFGVFQLITFNQIDSNGILNINFTSTTTTSGSIRVGLGASSNEDGGKSLAWAIPQLEQGSYATSYIPSSGSAATRVKDECNASGLSSVIGQTEGTIFIDFEYNQTPTDVNGRLLQLWGTNETTNSILPFIQGPGANENQFQLTIFSANTGTPAITASAATNVPFGRQKFAIAYNSGVYTVYRNGSLFASASSLVPVSLTALDLGGSSAADRSLVNPIKQAQLYNTRLSNSELATLTTL